MLIFAEFNLGSVKKDEAGIVLNGRYRDFDSAWYQAVGAKICVAMISQSVAVFGGPFAAPFIQFILRWLNRGCKKHLKKHNNWLVLKKKEEEANKEGGDELQEPG